MTDVFTGRPAAAPEGAHRLVAAAEQAIVASGVDPRKAREEARRVHDEAVACGNAEAAAVALRALALAARELGDLPLAESHLREAIRVGAGIPRRLAQARMSLVSVRTERGDPAGALRLADEAEDDLPAADRAALAVQRAIALVRLGRHGEAVRLCDRALAGHAAPGDVRFRSAALLNRGLALTYLGDHAAGAEDLAACLRIATAAGLDYVATLAEANLSFNAVRRGDIPAAFASFASAEQRLTGYPERLAALRGDFAEALVAAHLPGEARALLRQAVPELDAAGSLVHLAEARLFLAQVELLAGDPHGALTTARLARRELAGQSRHDWTPLADDVIVRARLAREPATHALLTDVVTCADALHQVGRTAPAAALRLTAARLAADLGDPRTAAAQLDQVIALCGPAPSPQPPDGHSLRDRSHRRTPPPGHPLAFHHAMALRRRLAGDHAGALEAVRAGLQTIGKREAPWDIRAHAARPAEELAALGLDLALHSGAAATVLAWAERWRACVRGEPPAMLSPDRLRAHLADAVLVELVRHGDALAAVTVTRAGCTLHRLGPYRAAVDATVRLRYCLRRRGLRDAHTGLMGADDGIAREAAALAALLLAPLMPALPAGPVVIVPTGALHTVPWPVLPPLRGRPICVVPSAAAWLASCTPHTDDTPHLPQPHHFAATAPAVRVFSAIHPAPALRAPAPPTITTQPTPITPDPITPRSISAQPTPTTLPKAATPPTPTSQPNPTAPPAATAQPTAGTPSAATAQPTATAAPTAVTQPTPIAPPAATAQPTAGTPSAVTAQPTPAVPFASAVQSNPGTRPIATTPPVTAAPPGTAPPAAGPSRAVRPEVIVVAGPGLAHAEAEASMVLGVYDGAVRVPARTDAVVEALGRADVAHLAAHGVFCAHSPLLSSIALDDGPLMAYDLLRLERAPRLVVLSACDAGMAHTPADGAPLGLAGTFLDRGAACVVASLVPVRDDEALTLMTAFHRLLAAGVAPAEALATAAETTAVPGFACLGAGWPAAASA